MADVNGTWLGTYWQEGIQTRFEATFVQSGKALSGRILDDNSLGEAQISGEVVGRHIQFTKRYLTASNHVIHYAGTLSEQADSMQGQWNIGVLHTGAWEAHRGSEDLTADLKNVLENQEPAVAKEPLVAQP
ncbi:MAG: hypothetical protein Kow00121_29110 [Elainellaceae cyanobacterium]